MKTQIDQYYSKKYDKLQEVANNILKNIDRCDLADTLVSESYLYLTSNIDKIEKSKSNLESIIVNFMTKQVIWKNTQFKKKFVYERNTELFDNYDYDALIDSDDFDDVLEKEFEHQAKINHIENKVKNLSIPDKILYDLAITGEYNTSGKLSRYLNLNRTTTYHMIKNLKKYLKDGYDTNDN